jgi:hypothetical protein
MGFKVNKAVAAEKTEEITIPLNVNIMYEDDTIVEGAEKPTSLEVYHVMRIPTTFEREKQQQMLIKIRGQNIKATGSSEAWFWLWKQCMLRLEGYDELPAERGLIIKIFEESTLLHIHAENAAVALLNHINASEGEITKK